MADFWELYPLDRDYDADESILSPLPKHTEIGWRHILRLCGDERPIGHGALDSFLSGPDLDSRIKLVADEVGKNEWLRLELKDTLTLDQTADWSKEQMARLRDAAGVGAG